MGHAGTRHRDYRMGKARTARSFTVPSTSSKALPGTAPMLPEQYTMPLYLTACENCGSGRGAPSVRTASYLGAMASQVISFARMEVCDEVKGKSVPGSNWLEAID